MSWTGEGEYKDKYKDKDKYKYKDKDNDRMRIESGMDVRRRGRTKQEIFEDTSRDPQIPLTHPLV